MAESKFKGFGKPPEGTGHRLWHYTLNTAHIMDLRSKFYPPDSLKPLVPIARRALREGAAVCPLPEPLDSYKVKLTAIDEAAVFDIYGARDLILTTNALAWTEDGAAECWEIFERLYLKMSGEFGVLGAMRAPAMPEQLPWLATFVLPNPEAMPLSWLASVEQSLAVTIIEQSAQGAG
ncbi:hypothetical protein [Gloeobacter morelensis]|uniref:hypothetical protein n=1 Tax=Gloeobacter morelensis TaxID=2907343 RepID=UPI001E433462|nr:hypothetical protein [Gloeobacter morelensis]UFP97275.1 hypothetical protein ISF26_24445 [Gloeobacter morelensis MG652769]